MDYQITNAAIARCRLTSRIVYGKMYVIGGIGDSDNSMSLSTLEEYDSSAEWSEDP